MGAGLTNQHRIGPGSCRHLSICQRAVCVHKLLEDLEIDRQVSDGGLEVLRVPWVSKRRLTVVKRYLTEYPILWSTSAGVSSDWIKPCARSMTLWRPLPFEATINSSSCRAVLLAIVPQRLSLLGSKTRC